MGNWFYDVEVFPNFFSATFWEDATREIKVFSVSKWKDQRKELRTFLREKDNLLIGFNNLYYDGAILNYVISNASIHLDVFFPELFELSSKLVSDGYRFDKDVKEYQENDFLQLDLMKVMAFDKLGVGLKQVAINLRHDRIQELPFPYDYELQSEADVAIVLDYNFNDVVITKKFYYFILEQINLRKDLSQLYNVDLSNASDSKMANIILENIYKQRYGVQELSRIQSLRTNRENVVLGDVISSRIFFRTNVFKNLLKRISKTVVRDEQNFKYKNTVKFGGVEYVMGVGGLHSVDTAAQFDSTDDIIIRDADIASMYPNIIILDDIIPEHLGTDFIEILKQITKERLEAKRSRSMVKANGLKITINSIFGKLKSNTFWLYDPKAMLSVTVSGQLYIFMLIERLVLNGIPVISANTDGIVCMIEKEKEHLYKQICKEWEQDTSFELEYTDYARYARVDVNNYITIKSDGKTKEKGRFVDDISLNRGYRHPIVPKALKAFFKYGIPVEETIYDCRDILDFCVSQKTGAKFITRTVDSQTGEIVELQKNNRFYICQSGVKLQKIDKTGNLHEFTKDDIALLEDVETGGVYGLYVNYLVKILNDYDPDIMFEEYDVDYLFYIDEANKYKNKILEAGKNIVPDINFIDEEEDEGLLNPVQELVDAITLKLRGIKNISSALLNKLVEMEMLKTEWPENFFEFLLWSVEKEYVAKKWEDLILVGYFDEFFNVSRQKMFLFFQEFRDGDFKYSKSLSEKSKTKRLIELDRVWSLIPDDEYPVQDLVDLEVSVAGRVVTKFPSMANYMYVVSVDTRFSPKLVLHSLKSGKLGTMKVTKDTWAGNELKEGDLILIKSFKKKPGGHFIEDEETKKQVWLEDKSITVLWLEEWENLKG